jgi:hypothetical protein
MKKRATKTVDPLDGPVDSEFGLGPLIGGDAYEPA